ncbi:MAG: anhydro-N-acetylmuramic acid kinase [Gammaproteobacteria bacterium]|nr:MAG: anhydro-N-acetylmuramic acid kinase [Gammaproteobacteria bacterium]
MSGTSMDAIDASLVRIVEDELEVIQYQQTPISKNLQLKLRSVNTTTPLDEISELDVIMGNLFAEAALQIIETGNLSPEDINTIGSHGQTILHLPHESHPRTLQIGDPNIIAYQTGVTTVADFRRMDIAAGGEGAPLAPVFHQWFFKNEESGRVILNIGGLANITILPTSKNAGITGFDTGPGNTLMDDWVQRHLSHDFDRDGQWAKSGQCHQQLLSTLLDESYFETVPPKSTGKDFFNLQWLDKKLSQSSKNIAPHDVQATLLELSAVTIRDAIQSYAADCNEILVCGGGVHNKVMMNRLRELHPAMDICSTEKHGLNPDAVEAVAFAWLAKCRMEMQPGNLTSVTGADEQVLLGAIYQAYSTRQALNN